MWKLLKAWESLSIKIDFWIEGDSTNKCEFEMSQQMFEWIPPAVLSALDRWFVGPSFHAVCIMCVCQQLRVWVFGCLFGPTLRRQFQRWLKLHRIRPHQILQFLEQLSDTDKRRKQRPINPSSLAHACSRGARAKKDWQRLIQASDRGTTAHCSCTWHRNGSKCKCVELLWPPLL